MRRVACLYLPNWPIDRLQRAERPEARPAPQPAPGRDAIGPTSAAEHATRCPVAKEGGWRPGARWARESPAGSRAQVEVAVEALPAHRRPPQRELGRVSEAAPHPFAGVPVRENSRHVPAAEHPSPHLRGVGSAPTNAWPTAAALDAVVAALPAHRRPSFGEMSRRSELVGNPFRPPTPVEAGIRPPPTAPACPGAVEGSPARRASGRGETDHPLPPAAKLARLGTTPAAHHPGEGPYPDHGRTASAPRYGEGRFQTARTLGGAMSRACPEREEPPAPAAAGDARPLVTMGRTGARVEIVAACPAALALGLVPGLALTQARATVPGLDVRPADPAGDAADLARLAQALARRWTPVVAPAGDDGLLLDLSGVSHLHGGEARMARRLVRLLGRAGVAARVAVADTAGAAWALAHGAPHGPGSTERDAAARRARVTGGPQPGGNGQGAIGWAGDAPPPGAAPPPPPVLIVPPGAHVDAIAPLPPAALRLAPAALEMLARLGIDRVGQLLAMPRAPLERRFGRALVARLDQATGALPEPLDPVVPRETVMVEQRFAEPVATAEAIAHWLAVLAPRLGEALAAAGLGARAVELVAERVDGVPQRLRLGFARPVRDPAHLLRLACRRIEEIDPGYGIDALMLIVRRADPLGPETLGQRLAGEVPPDLAPLVDALANRIGPARLWRAAPLESDVPERSVGTLPPLDPPAAEAHAPAADDVRRLDERARDHPWHPRWPRPALLLRRPERVDNVLYGLPDRPPVRFTWRGRQHRVVCADGPERIAGEWWRRPGERRAVRDYFRVEDEGGERFWLYRRGDGVRAETGDLAWFVHGRFA